MKAINLLAKTMVVLGATVTLAYASDRTAVYARVDKVVLEPSADSPETVQVWGVFSVARPNWDGRSYKPGDDYLPAARGYLYFTLAADRETARKEWADLRRVAGTGQIVSFGSRFELRLHVRKASERAVNPDPYIVHTGMTKVRSDTDYPPVRTLVDYRE